MLIVLRFVENSWAFGELFCVVLYKRKDIKKKNEDSNKKIIGDLFVFYYGNDDSYRLQHK